MNENGKVTYDEKLQGDALLVQLMRAYRTAHYGTMGRPQEELDKAREFIGRFGPMAVDTAIKWLNECKPDNPDDEDAFQAGNEELIFNKVQGDHRQDYLDLLRLLAEIGDERAVEPLLHHLRVAPERGAGTTKSILKFFARVEAKQTAKTLLLYLQNSWDSVWREAMAYGLGLLEIEETRGALLVALD